MDIFLCNEVYYSFLLYKNIPMNTIIGITSPIRHEIISYRDDSLLLLLQDNLSLHELEPLPQLFVTCLV